MAHAEIYLEDVDGPQAGASVRFVFPKGFDAASPAHQLTNILRMKLDEMAQAGELTALTEREEHGDMSAANEQMQRLELVAADD